MRGVGSSGCTHSYVISAVRERRRERGREGGRETEKPTSPPSTGASRPPPQCEPAAAWWKRRADTTACQTCGPPWSPAWRCNAAQIRDADTGRHRTHEALSTGTAGGGQQPRGFSRRSRRSAALPATGLHNHRAVIASTRQRCVVAAVVMVARVYLRPPCESARVEASGP